MFLRTRIAERERAAVPTADDLYQTGSIRSHPVASHTGACDVVVRSRDLRRAKACASLAGATLLLLASCRVQDGVGPNGAGAPHPRNAPSTDDTTRTVLLAQSPRVFAAAAAPRDSAGTRLRRLLGHVQFAPTHDDVFTLSSIADTTVTNVVGALGVTVVIGGREIAHVSVAELTARAISFPIRVSDRDLTVLLDRDLSTSVASRPLTGTFRLSLATASTVIQRRMTPWGSTSTPGRTMAASSAPGLRRSTAVDDGCALDDGTAQGTCGSVQYQVNPYFAYFGSTSFQSDSGHAASRSVTLTFTAPVTTVNVVVGDPTWAGNTAVAYDTSGAVVASTDFDPSGQPGTDIPSERSLSAPAIVRVVLTPAPNDYVYYGVSVNVVDSGPPTVRCLPGSVPRGSAAVTCHASKFNSVGSWTFQSDDGRFTISRPAGETGDWGGTVVTSGTVTVHGRAAGIPNRTATTRIEVTARDWTSSVQPIDVRPISQTAPPPEDQLPSKPTAFNAQFGRTIPVFTPQASTQVIAQGPNAGLAFFPRVPLHVTAEVRINAVALDPNSEFGRIQPPTDRVVDGRPLPVCGRDRFPTILALIQAHEGLGGENGSHAERLHGAATFMIGKLYESYVGWARDDVPGALYDAVVSYAKRSSALRDTDPYNNLNAATLNCEFNYDYDNPIP